MKPIFLILVKKINLFTNSVSVSSLLSINAVELRDALTTNSNVTRGRKYQKLNYPVLLPFQLANQNTTET